MLELELSDDDVISLSESALRDIDFDPVRPIPSYGCIRLTTCMSLEETLLTQIELRYHGRYKGQRYPDYGNHCSVAMVTESLRRFTNALASPAIDPMTTNHERGITKR